MDDAFEVSDHSSEDSQVNRFVKCLVDVIDEAASEVHLANIRLRPPKKFPTPYGGRLEWTLPGKNKMICHLKDKSKIRHRKRWSQVRNILQENKNLFLIYICELSAYVNFLKHLCKYNFGLHLFWQITIRKFLQSKTMTISLIFAKLS